MCCLYLITTPLIALFFPPVGWHIKEISAFPSQSYEAQDVRAPHRFSFSFFLSLLSYLTVCGCFMMRVLKHANVTATPCHLLAASAQFMLGMSFGEICPLFRPSVWLTDSFHPSAGFPYHRIVTNWAVYKGQTKQQT